MQYIQNILTVIGALGALATALSHLPIIPLKTQTWFARFGMTTAKFAVSAKSGQS